MEKKIICLPRKSANKSTLESFTYNGCTYLFDTKNFEILEMVACREEHSSWFINNFVEQDGSLTMLTPVDITYLLLPTLMKNQKTFRSLRDILSQEENWERLYQCCVENKLDVSVVADIKTIDDEEYIKYNCDKTLDWLKCKVALVKHALFENQVSTSTKCAQISGFVSGREIEDKNGEDILRYAAELVMQYLPEELETQLFDYLNIKPVEMCKETNVTDEPNCLKRSYDTKTAEEYFDDSDARKKQNAKKVKISKTQRDLEKHKRGTKSVASFFKPMATK